MIGYNFINSLLYRYFRSLNRSTFPISLERSISGTFSWDAFSWPIFFQSLDFRYHPILIILISQWPFFFCSEFFLFQYFPRWARTSRRGLQWECTLTLPLLKTTLIMKNRLLIRKARFEEVYGTFKQAFILQWRQHL